MSIVDQPLAEARGRSQTKDNKALLADKLFDDDQRTKHLLAEVLQRQEDEIHRLQCISQQRQRDIQRQEDEIHKLREELASFREEVALERAYDRRRLADLEDLVEREGLIAARARQRITALETPAPALRDETAAAHLDRLFSEMRRLNLRQVTTKDAARLLEISKRQMKDVKSHLAADSRFVVVKDPCHKQRHLIRLV